MSTGQVIRDAAARHAVLLRYAAAYDRFATQEQLLTERGRVAEANGAHIFALRLLRAYRAEMDDPEPRRLETP